MSCLFALAVAQPARSISYDQLLSTPDRDPCHLFTDDADLVILYLDMGVEGEVQLSLPRPYLEDRADQQSGLRHGSLLLRTMLTNFLPVSHAQSLGLSVTRQNTSRQTAFVTILIGDFPDLGTRLTAVSQAALDASPNDFGLIPLPETASTPRKAFASVLADGTLRTIIECTSAETTPRSTCTHQFRTSGVDVVLDYNADQLARWEDTQTRVERFLSCAAEG